MKFRKLAALLSAAAMLATSCIAVPVTASAAEEEVLLSHTMATQEDVDKVKDGYIERITSEKGTTITWTNAGGGSMNIKDEGGRYNSSGVKYDITDLVADKEGSVTITSDVRGGWGSTLNVYMGFFADDDTQIDGVYTAQTADGSTGAFTTLSYTADKIPSYKEKLYFFVSGYNPELNLKNVKLTYTPAGSEEPAKPTATPAGEATATPTPTATPTAKPTIKPHDPSVTYDFTIADENGAADIYIDKDGADYDGISLVADTFAGDVNAVTDQTPAVKTASDAADLSGVIIAGTVNDALIKSTGITTTDIEGKNEVYKIELVGDNLVIAGSDKRGTIYGIFHISELMGVSPWIYWGDVAPEKKAMVGFNAGDNCVSKEPSVKYRGIFLNDEAPNLTSWADHAFEKHFGPEFYDKVFELILRLKGNYLWPAMWGNEFYQEGDEGSKNLAAFKKAKALHEGALANGELADKYGIVMSTSHHEPMGRAGNEWGQLYRNYLNADDAKLGSAATWDYNKYAYALDKFWKDGYDRMKDYEEVVTIGMRGEADSSLAGTLDENIQNLKNVITSQFNLIKEVNPEKKQPTVLALYKEVEDYWLGKKGDQTSDSPLRDWEVDGQSPLKDTIIMLTNDNFGNVRTLPDDNEREGKYGGWGMYYHFDYNGGPRSYRWVSSVQLEKIWQNMTDCYEYGVDDIWIVNVGDLKPHEMEISYFLDLAYDMNTWGTVNKTEDYTKQWTAQQFKQGDVTDDTIDQIAQLQTDYLKLNATRRAEVVFPETYSITDSNELYGIIDRARSIYKRAEDLEAALPAEMRDSFYNLVGYAAKGSANVTLLNAYSALAKMYGTAGSLLANTYSQMLNDGLALDKTLMERYNKEMSGGKWDGMMHEKDPVHIGAKDWGLSSDAQKLPQPYFVTPSDGKELIVFVDGSVTGVKTGKTATLPTFTSANKEAYSITVSNGGKEKLDYTATASADWIKLTKTSGSVYAGESVGVTVDWNSVSADAEGTVKITSGDQSVTVNVKADVVDTTGLGDKVFIGKDGEISIEAEHYTDQKGMITVNNLGKNLSTIRTAKYTGMNEPAAADAPYAQYKVKVDEAGEYTVTAITGPSNPRTTTDRLNYWIKVNDGNPVSTESIQTNFIAGDNGNGPWNTCVLDSAHYSSQKVNLNAGENTITFYPSNSAIALQKLVISASGKEFAQRDGETGKGQEFIGPVESYYGGKIVEQQKVVYPAVDDTMTIPGIVPAGGKVIVTGDGSYQITATEPTGELRVSLDGEELTLENGGENVYITDLTAGEYDLTFTGASSLEFELMNLTPGIVIDHPMSSQADVNAVQAGYKNRVDGNDDKRVVTFDGGGMKYETTGLYPSSGFKYDISSIVKRVIAEYGDVEFTLSMDIKSEVGDNAKMGFMKESSEIASTPLTDVTNSDYTTVTCKTKLSNQDKVYFFLAAGKPASWVKNIKITYPAPIRQDIFTHSKSGDFDNYTLYDEEDTGSSINKGDSIVCSFSNGWNGTNGVKIDVTDYVKGLSGMTFGASASVTTTANGEVKQFIEVVPASGEPTSYRLSSGERAGEGDNNVELSGEVEGVTFASTDKVYLCVTQWSGYASFDNISLWAYKIDTPQTKTQVFKHTFNAQKAEQVAMYEPYEENGGTVSEGVSPVLKYDGQESEASEYGVKVNITDMLQSDWSGLTFGASALVKPGYSWSGSNYVDIFFEKVSGGKTDRIDLGEALPSNTKTDKATDSETGADLGENWLVTPVTGEAALTFAAGDTVYLCVTTSSSQQWLDDIELYYYEGEGGDEPPTEETITLYDSAADGIDSWKVYDADNADAAISDYGSGSFGVNYGDGHGWDENNGVKMDVTEYVKQCGSGSKFEVAFNLSNGAWTGDGGTLNMPSVFFEIDGEKTNLALSAPTSVDDLIDGEPPSADVKASGTLDFKDGDTVYLCLMHKAGYHGYKDIVLKGVKKGSVKPPVGSGTILDDNFDDGEVSGYEVYDPDVSTNETLTVENNKLKFHEDDGWHETNGIKKDITELAKAAGFASGGKLTVSADIACSWGYDGNLQPAKIFIEKNGDRSDQTLLAQDSPAEQAYGEYTVTGSNVLTFDSNDKIYLCITQVNGDQTYDNILLTFGEDEPEPTEKPVAPEFTVNKPAMDENGAFVIVTNTTDENKAVNIYDAKYDGEILESVAVTKITAETGARNQRIAIAGASEGDKIFVWDNNMKPLTEKATLEQEAWIAGWGSAQLEDTQADTPKLGGTVIRQIMRMSAGGDKMTLTLSNAYGNGDLKISAVHLAKPLNDQNDGKIDVNTDTVVTFGGQGSVTIPKGQRVTSDIISFSAENLEDIMVTIEVEKCPAKITGHGGARAYTYIKNTAAGATAGDEDMGRTRNTHWYFASEIDVLKPDDYGLIACLGDSITDGYGTDTGKGKPYQYTRWTDELSRRVNEKGLHLSVVNDGIGGNAINGWGLGEDGRSRFKKEIKFRKGLKYLIILEGVNDFGNNKADTYNGPSGNAPSDGKITTGIKEAYSEIIDAAHEQGVKVIGIPVLPCGASGYYQESGGYIETMRQNVNDWIRTSGKFDAVIDMEGWIGDGATPPCLKSEYNNDGLHPSPDGYIAMGQHIDLSLFEEPYNGSSGNLTPEEYMKKVQENISEYEPSGITTEISPSYYGTIEKRTYYSNTAGRDTKVNVLLPAGYSKAKKYPVLYMLHGYWGNEDSLLDAGDPSLKLRQILGNLNAAGEAEEMIVVFPYIFCSKDKETCDGMNLENTLCYDNFVNDLLTDLKPFIEKEYSVKTGRENTAISGFSQGGREALFIGITHSDLFGYVGGVCPAPGLTPGADLSSHPGQLKEDELKTDPAKGKPYFLMISAAKNDGMVGNNPENYHNILTRNGEPHVWHTVTNADHDGRSIRPHFYNFVKAIFKNGGDVK